MIAYRMGYSPDQAQEVEPHKQFSHARIGVKEAEAYVLPCGVRFGDASPEQLVAWFQVLLTISGKQRDRLGDLLVGLDLTVKLDRWYALNELLERSKRLRDVFDGHVQVETVHPLNSVEEVKELLAGYGLGFQTITNHESGKVRLFASRYQPKVRVVLGSLAALSTGQITRESVMERLIKTGLIPESETA